MRGESPCVVCCSSLCQHPECWRANLQQVREAVWRRNGVHPTSRSSVDTLYLRQDEHSDVGDDLPSLKVVDMFNDLGNSIKNSTKKYLKPIHQRSSSLPCLPSTGVSPESVPSPTKTPQQSPVVSSPPLTENQRKMRWKQHIAGPSRVDTATSGESTKSVRVSTIGVHELYEPDEMDQEWQEVYVTSAYLVWCPSNKKKRRAKRSSRSSSASSSKNQSKKVALKDVTEDLVPASFETVKPCRPKSTKTPTGGQPFSPHRALTNSSLGQYGMEDLSDLPKPVLSGILKRITWRSPNEENQDSDKNNDNKKVFDEAMELEQSSQKMLLAVDINSKFTTPEEDEQKEKETIATKEETDVIDEPTPVVQQADTSEVRHRRELLSMHPIGLPIDELPEPKYHHCTNSIPRRLSLGVGLEPVDLVPITPSPMTTPMKPSLPNYHEVATIPAVTNDPASLVVNVPSGRPESTPIPHSMDAKFDDRYYVNNAFRYTPSPVRAPAPTPITPDRYAEYTRYSRGSHSRRRSSSHDEPLKMFQRWNTLASVYDTEYPPTTDIVLAEREFVEGGGVFLTEGVELDKIATPTTQRCRSPSPGSRTCIPRDIIDQFHGDIYGRRYDKTEDRLTSNALTHGSTGIVAPGWRQPRSRTPIQISETPGRCPPRPLRQPPKEAVPKSLKIVSIPKPKGLVRPRSTPPRTSTPRDNEYLPLVLSDTSLVSTSVSMEVRGPSSIVTDSGAVPPPPSPEATATLKNADLQPALLETLCEEDERSSRATSIVDVMDKEIPLARLSPLGGGSEMSDESVDIPIDDLNQLNDELTDEITAQEPTQEKQSLADDEVEKQQSLTHSNLDSFEEQHTVGVSEHAPLLKESADDAESDQQEKSPEQRSTHEAAADNQPAKGPADSHLQDEASESDLRQTFSVQPQGSPTKGETREQIARKNSMEEPPDQPPGSPDISSKQGSPTQGETSEQIARKNSMEEPPDQPPGSPDINSNQDFTEGLDMGMDLAAELQAAMEGLDDFSLDDDDDNANDDSVL